MAIIAMLVYQRVRGETKPTKPTDYGKRMETNGVTRKGVIKSGKLEHPRTNWGFKGKSMKYGWGIL